MEEEAYTRFVKLMASDAAIKSNLSRRRGYEQRYFDLHYAKGIRLRGKYRPEGR